MTTANPYSPPRADVEDFQDEDVGFSEPKVWSARGRIGRLRYMSYTMCGYFAFAIIGMLAALMGAKASAPAMVTIFMVIGGIGYLALAIFSAIQRAHDMDWSGWMIFIAIIPLAGLIWIFKAGTEGSNRFGAPPPPNTIGIKLGALLFPLIMVIGILAAIALPQYQKYTQRAKAIQQMQQMQPH
jgi:uncharacterized membrane protein YhaH (DUF805 family)